jgi:nucleotide-binding universal stress UspA family protein
MKPNEPTPIICGTDFSENAAHAATSAAVLAARSGKPLLLVHVADEFNGRGDDQKKLTAFLRPVAKQLRAEAYRLKKAGATVETKVLTGQLAERAIKELVEKRPAALVVVSSVSKTAFDRWTLGTASESLAESVASPTLVVRSAAPFEAWARGERPLKIFVAVDGASVSEAALRWVRDLRALGPCDIVVAQVDRPAEECERLGVFTRILENPTEVQRVLERDLRKRVRAQFGKENVRIVVEPMGDRPDARLIELAVEAQADVIVVGTHQRHGLGRVGHPSVSRGILRHAPMSVACVPASAFVPEGGRIPEVQRVLVATDFSELGDRAVPFAYGLVREGGTVFLLHVTHPMPLPSPLTMNLGSKMDRALEKHTTRLREASARLRALIPSGAERRGVASEVAVVEPSKPKGLPHVGMYYGIMGEAHVVEDTDPARAICQAAERFDADVICLGSHGRSGFSAALMGSVAQAVMAQSRRPVLVVRPPSE